MSRNPATLAALHPAMREMLAIFEAFRRYGFSSDDIYVTPYAKCPQTGRKEPAVMVRRFGKTFAVTTGIPFEGDDAAFSEAWGQAGSAWNSAAHTPLGDGAVGGDPEVKSIWEGSRIASRLAELAVGLAGKGFASVVLQAKNERSSTQ